MKKKTTFTVALVATFALGFAFQSFISAFTHNEPSLKRVTGIGGIFFKCKDPKKMNQWYKEHLGLNTNEYGAFFEWRQAADSSKKGFTEWNPFPDTTTYFTTSQAYMINYRVADLDALVAALKKENVTIADTIQTYDYGKFVHIMDGEGNKVELWQPDDVVFDKMGKQMGAVSTK